MTTYTDPGAIADVVGTTGRIEANWGNAIRARVVNRFSTTADRDSAISSPTEGMLCVVTGDNAEYLYSGSAWLRRDYVARTSFTPQIDQGASTNISKTVGVTKFWERPDVTHFTAWMTLSAGGTAGSAVTVSTPVTYVGTAGLHVGTGYIYDASVTTRYVVEVLYNSTTTVTFVADVTSAAGWGANPNVALASSDQIGFTVDLPMS